MSFLNVLFCTDINTGVRQYRATPGAVLLDVRPQERYDHSHIPESQNLPLSEIHRAAELLPDQNVPLYVYAYGGDYSAKAVSRLKKMGYKNVNDIGGIKKCCGAQGYHGPTESCGLQACDDPADCSMQEYDDPTDSCCMQDRNGSADSCCMQDRDDSAEY